MQKKSCFFIGHREAPDSLLPALMTAVEQHIAEFGVTEFVVGHYGNFDRLAAQAVITAKAKYQNISLLLLLPYHPAERPVSTPPGFDSTYFPFTDEAVPRRLSIIYANRYMIDHSDYLITYAHYPASNTEKLLDYAKRRSRNSFLSITNLPLILP